MSRQAMMQEEEENEINLTPMLDVVFIMLIFFIVTASFIKEAGIDVDRPDAPTAESWYFANGVVPEAEDYYRNIAPTLLINAKLDMNEQQFLRSREALDKYLIVKPSHAEAHYLRGETFRRSNPAGPDFTEPLNAYQSALTADPGYADAHKEIGMAYRMQGQNAQAAESFERYLELAPDAPDAGIIRGYLEGLRRNVH